MKSTYDEWKTITKYGLWRKVDVVFFDLRGLIGETISAFVGGGMI